MSLVRSLFGRQNGAVRSAPVVASRRFACDVRGSIAVLFSFVLPPLAVGVVIVIELAEVYATRTSLQSNVDLAALVGARQFALDRSSATAMRAQTQADERAENAKVRWTVETSASSSSEGFTVTQKAVRQSLFGNLVPPGGFRISVSATAATTPTAPLCVLALETSSGNTIAIGGASSILAGGCLVHSNNDIVVEPAARLAAARVRSGRAARGNVTPPAVTDSPTREDPFASLSTAPPSSVCVDTNFSTATGTTTLNPGVHCGNVDIGGVANVVLAPGDHYFTGSKFEIGGAAVVSGVDVALIFANPKTISVGGLADLRLEGRRSGTFAGFVIVVDRTFTGAVSIAAQTVKKLLGTLYAPGASLTIAGASGVLASDSPWTVVIARRVDVSGASQMQINSNYLSSSVPVPQGVGNKTDPALVRLVR